MNINDRQKYMKWQEAKAVLPLDKYADGKFTSSHTAPVSIYSISKAFKADHVAVLLDNWLNSFEYGFERGQYIGRCWRNTHRTLQRTAVRFALGILCGIAEQEYSDPRNADALAMAQKVKAMYDAGELDTGRFI